MTPQALLRELRARYEGDDIEHVTLAYVIDDLESEIVERVLSRQRGGTQSSTTANRRGVEAPLPEGRAPDTTDEN